MKQYLTTNDVQEMLKAEIGNGKQIEWATKHKVSPQYVWDILHGHREPGKKILQALGLRRIRVYERAE